MKELLQNLLQLQTIEFSEIENEGDDVRIFELRQKIPAQILGHYDRLVARGKKGIAAVRHQTCAACHMNVPLGSILTLQRGDDIQMCGNCGRYLYLDEKSIEVEPPKRKYHRKSAPLIPA
jgi:predicted  nucleic acid-binding Zn-ribbon protein